MGPVRVRLLSLCGRNAGGKLWVLQRGAYRQPDARGTIESLTAAREGFERQYILSVLKRVDGNRSLAAKILGISRKALWEKCKRYTIPQGKQEPTDEDG